VSRPGVFAIPASSDLGGMTGLNGMLFLLAALLTQIPARADAPAASRTPACNDASHARLIVQNGRDVCAPTLLPTGPVSVGFLPTTCPAVLPVLQIDALRSADICAEKPAVASQKTP
jgi:hypothetical protein